MKYIIITTHGNILRSYFSFISNKYSKHFNNCCIIKCFVKQDKIIFNMIYEGFNYNIKSFSIQEFNDLNY
jgi:hypothetical protein